TRLADGVGHRNWVLSKRASRCGAAGGGGTGPRGLGPRQRGGNARLLYLCFFHSRFLPACPGVAALALTPRRRVRYTVGFVLPNARRDRKSRTTPGRGRP